MAVATPVIERRFSQQITEREERSAGMNADELHNSRMRDNLARLLNPENKIKDVVASIDSDGAQVVKSAPAAEVPAQPARSAQMYEANGIIARRAPVQEYASEQAYAPVQEYAQPSAAEAQPLYVVKNARANADIFRADSAINHPAQAYAPTPEQAYFAARTMAQAMPAAQPQEEESEDLRPTPTTIQYQTISADGTAIAGRSRAMQEGEIVRPEERAENSGKITLAKRDKVIIGVIVGLILAVFVLIIVNSAIISGLNSDISQLEGMVYTAREAYESALSEVENVTSFENVYKVAVEQGWIG